MLTLSVRLPVNNRLFIVKFWGIKSYTQIFHCVGVGAPNPRIVQGPAVFPIFSSSLYVCYYIFLCSVFQDKPPFL